MKKFIFLQFAALSFSFVSISATAPADTSIIITHKMDGLADEWPADKFSTDNETGIQYALDNDAENLYIALIITSQPEQLKLMGMGMRMFIDMKAKRKENRGVEFPITRETGSMPMPQPEGPVNGQLEKTDLKQVRMMFARNLLSLKLFGFTDAEPTEQELEINGSVRIAFNWDSLDVMQIEYLIPLKMLEPDITSLNQKLISIGWKVNGIDMQGPSTNTNAPTAVRTGVVAVPAGSAPPSTSRTQDRLGGPRPGSGKFIQSDKNKMMKEQEIWTKYTLTIPVK